MKTVIMLATFHECQSSEVDPSPELEKTLNYLRLKLGFQIVLEEWAEKLGESVAAKWCASVELPWLDVGTPDEPQFRTISGKVRYPGHNGTLKWDPRAPQIDEYGPFEAQENREKWMMNKVRTEMRPYQAGLFIVGVAHMHSLFAKLLASDLKVVGYSSL